MASREANEARERPRTRAERLQTARMIRRIRDEPSKYKTWSDVPLEEKIWLSFRTDAFSWAIGFALSAFALGWLATSSLLYALLIAIIIGGLYTIWFESRRDIDKRLERYCDDLLQELEEHERKKDEALR